MRILSRRKVLLLIPLLTWDFATAEEAIAWKPFDAAAIATAKNEHKLLFLDVEAVWCHWCHVMEKKTFSEPEVQRALAENFVSTKLDQDSRPDLSRRYEEYGWPALVVLDPVTLEERGIASGFQTKEEFLTFLNEARSGKKVEDFAASAKASATGALSEAQKTVLLKKLRERYDRSATGWGSGSKFIPWGNIEYCLRLAGEGDAGARKMAEDTLTEAVGLIDPVWGGVYQYSTDGDWAHPHFEKIMEFQAEISRVYAMSYLVSQRPADLKAAEDIARHLNDVLRSPEGAYYVSQDADVVPGEHSADYFSMGDKERRAIGVPRVDKHIYSRENGMAIAAQVALYQASGDIKYLEQAKTAATWIIANRSLTGGGFSHGAVDSQGPFLADQVYMGRALLMLYQATGDKVWLDRSVTCADFCMAKFRREEANGAGYLSGPTIADAPAPVVDRDENIEVARWLNLLGRNTGEARFLTAAGHAMRFLATDAMINDIYSFTGGLLLADAELGEEPVHIVVVGDKADPAAAALFGAAQHCPTGYKLIEWLEPSVATAFPKNDKAAAYLCTATRCSSPRFTPTELQELYRK